MEQVIIIGAGPCGLSAAIELKKAGIDALIIEKGAVVQSISHYPTYMIFHSTPELLEIGDIPFTTVHEKSSRQEALNYYRIAANRYQLRIHSYEKVTGVEPTELGYRLRTVDRFGDEKKYECARVIIATGYFDHPNRLGIPGEDLPKVSSRYQEAHPFTGLNVAIVGGNNSAVDAALDLERAGAKVTVIDWLSSPDDGNQHYEHLHCRCHRCGQSGQFHFYRKWTSSCEVDCAGYCRKSSG